MRLRASDVSDSPTRCAQVELPRTEPKLLTNRGPGQKASPLGRDGDRLAMEGGSLVLHLAVAVILCAYGITRSVCAVCACLVVERSAGTVQLR